MSIASDVVDYWNIWSQGVGVGGADTVHQFISRGVYAAGFFVFIWIMIGVYKAWVDSEINGSEALFCYAKIMAFMQAYIFLI